MGVFATQGIKSSEKIVELRGNYFTIGQIIKKKSIELSAVFFQIGKELYLKSTDGIGAYLNHSCNPNAWIKISGRRVWLVALRRIKQGEEVTFDYSTTMNEDDWEMDCKCGSRNCRKRIRDFKYLPKMAQRKYMRLGIIPKYILAASAPRG